MFFYRKQAHNCLPVSLLLFSMFFYRKQAHNCLPVSFFSSIFFYRKQAHNCLSVSLFYVLLQKTSSQLSFSKSFFSIFFYRKQAHNCLSVSLFYVLLQETSSQLSFSKSFDSFLCSSTENKLTTVFQKVFSMFFYRKQAHNWLSVSLFYVFQSTSFWCLIFCVTGTLLIRSEVGIKASVSDPEWIRIQMGQKKFHV
jgi:hypothetical protein